MKKINNFFIKKLSHNGDYDILDLTQESVLLSPCGYSYSPFVYKLIRFPIPHSLRISSPVLSLLEGEYHKFIFILPRYIMSRNCYFVNSTIK